MNLRAISLDKTPPADYDPPDELPWDPTLTQIADHYGSDKGTLKHNYTEHYERLLAGRRAEAFRLLEIGVACGASLKMWSRYFPHAAIIGMDIRPECAYLCGGWANIGIVIADATKDVIGGQFDVVIDDGSHLPGHIVKAFKLYWPKVSAGGVYVIEDTRCTHNPNYVCRFPHDAADRDRAPLMQMIDTLMRNCDNGGEVESVQCWREMIAVRKR